MATTKYAITQKNAIAIVRNYIEMYPDEFIEATNVYDATVDDLLETLGNMFQKLNTTRKNTNSKKRDENLNLLDQITTFLGEPHTAGEVRDFLPDQISSVPKATAVLKLGVEEGVLVRLKKTKKNESFRYVLAGMAIEDEIDAD